MIAPARILDFYFDNKFRLVYWPMVGDDKGPRQEGWTSRTYTRDDYTEGMRVGIMCGVEISPGKFLHDVDIDWGLGAPVALAILQATDLMYGRSSKKISHCWYTTSEALTSFKYADPVPDGDIKDPCLIELRGTKLDGTIGNQTMAPPSIWSKGGATEPLTFARMQVPFHIETPSHLRQRVCMAAIAMLLARHFGKAGFGHDARLAWAGFLLRAGLSVAECIDIGNAIMLYTGNSDKADIRLAVDSTHKRLEGKDKKVRGGPALAKILGANGKAIVKRINEWLGRDSDFIRNGDGIIIKDHQENIIRALDMLNMELSYNEFADKMLFNRTQPLEDRQVNEMWFRIDEEYKFRPSPEFFEKVIKRIAWNNSFHPVRDYFATLSWDGVPRIEEWLIKAGDAVDNEYIRSISSIVLIAAVRRIKTPGCKYDEMLVLESQQGLQKSSALRALCPQPDWFSDDFQLNVNSQRLIESTVGKWIIEVSELAGMRLSLVELLKSNLSRQVDGPARMAYAHLPIERQRQFILIGTTNSDSYLADPTGARRFWPAKVSKFDVAWIIAHRDQLWAEAVHREAAGESNRLPEHLWAVAGEQQEQRREVDPWETLIRAALVSCDEWHSYDDGLSRVVTASLWNVLGVEPEKRSRPYQMRLSEIMQRLGFLRKRVRPHGEPTQTGYQSISVDWLARAHAEDANAHEVVASAARHSGDPDDF